MKLSLKFEGEDEDQQHRQIMRAKVPISIFNHPFMSGITATTTGITATTTAATQLGSEFSFSLSTNFPSGPSFKLSYSPTASTSSFPFSLSLKSGLGIFGSPRHSPLVFSANFSLSPSYTPVPAFFLHFKPQFGHFSLNKTVFSDPNTDRPSGSFTNARAHSGTASLDNNSEVGKGFVPDGSSSVWHELNLEPCGATVRGEGADHSHVDNRDVHSNVGGNGFALRRSLIGKNNEKYGLSPGVAVMARTVMPVTKGLLLNLRWGVNIPGNLGLKRPYLIVNKIGLEGVEKVKHQNKQSTDISDSDLQLLKGMCFWMKRDLEIVEKENREMKRLLDEMKMGVSTRNYREEGNGVGRKLSQHSGESSSNSEFERWRSKKNGREENEQREPKKSQSLASDVESELQKAIKAAASS